MTPHPSEAVAASIAIRVIVEHVRGHAGLDPIFRYEVEVCRTVLSDCHFSFVFDGEP
jgi:hypothetical protein